ncbi:SDR family NAD(P)-dependent oxidoreductase [Nocardia uniformis]|uniref:SDR family NAD(P)-dependent oxidoreductase n=2 Tax=Nocardia uniformis TaxID=53432 RepID=UPI002892C93D|nr:SDR family NAD(P)-dependent oxidoreductase [Nocardia uniformis]
MSEETTRIGRRLADNPIAIVGMSSLFPMARNHRDYWQNIVDGQDCTTEVPESRWKVSDYYDPDPDAPDKTYSRRGAFLPDIDFDPLEFGLPPNQLDVTTTMQTLSLMVARDLLKDSGADTSDWYRPARTGVVLGTTGPVPLMHPLAARLSTPVLKEVVRAAGLTAADADEIADRYVRAFAPWEENSFPGFLANVVAGRVANRLDLGGLNCTVDAACAASLAAMRTAIAELVDGRADMMITGGVDTENTIFVYMSFGKVGALSKSDRIRPFSDDADGTLLGEGIGMLALRRLADAERDGNRIYAVIRGLGSSSDGRAKSIYAPRAEGQRIALDRAYEDADCSPASVELFEAHATGTAVGDRTELTALRELLADNAAPRHGAALGSVKSQIGHTKGAAGTASVMKLSLALYHKVFPPTINVDRPNSGIDFDSAPFYVSTKLRPWIRDPRRAVRRAAASAMGFGGTNFHMVLEEYDGDRSAVRNLHRTARANLWHAPDPAALLDLLNSGAPAVDGGPVPAAHARVGFAAADDNTAARLRALVAERLSADPDAEQWSLPQGVYFRRQAPVGVKVGALFAGQGSQYLDMGLEAVVSVPTVADAFDAANAAFPGEDPGLAAAVYPPPIFDPKLRQQQESTLRRTEYAQPAIGALAAGQFRFLRELGLRCDGMLGHSFGELTALWAADALTDADYFRLAAARGTAMAPVADSGDTGAMAAIAATRDMVEELLAETPDVLVCNHNAPEQVVVGGGTEAVEALLAECTRREITARRLPVSAAFHTPYVGHAVEHFRAALNTVDIGAPAVAVYANSPGAAYAADSQANADTLARQLLRPVEFVEAVRAMHADGVTVFVEFGPKQVLTGLVRTILADTDVVAVPTDSGPLGDSDLALKQAAVQLAVLGVDLDGINRYDAPALAEPARKGMTVSLSAPEYISPARRAAYADGLTDGFRVSALATPPAPAPAAVPTPVYGNGAVAHHIQEEHPMTVHPQARNRSEDDPATQHLALHSRYLDSQLNVAETLIGLIAQHGLDDPNLPNVIASVRDQSVAIGHAHERAAEVLARLSELESAVAPAVWSEPVEYRPAPPATAGVAPRPLTAATPAVAPVPTTPAAVVPAPVATPPPAPEPAVTQTAPQIAVEPSSSNGHVLDAEAVRAALVEVVADKTGYPTDLIDPTMDLEADLGVDSIKRVQVLGIVQERFPDLPVVGPEVLGELRTLDQMVDVLVGEAGGVYPKAPSPTAEPSSEVGPAPTLRHRVELVDLPAIDVMDAPFRDDPVAVVADHGGVDATKIVAGLEQRGWTVRRIDLSGAADAASVERSIGEVCSATVDLVLAVADGEPTWAGAERQLTEVILLAKYALGSLTGTEGRAAFLTLTRLDGGLGCTGAAAPEAGLVGGVGGVVKTLAAEAPRLFCRAVDVHPDLADDQLLAAVFAELDDAAVDTLEVGVDLSGRRRAVVPGRYPHPVDTSPVGPETTAEPLIEPDDVFVVTGGARGVTALCVAALAESGSAEFILLGRTELTAEPEWAAGVVDADLRAAVIDQLRVGGDRPVPRDIARVHGELVANREIRSTLDRLHAAGSRATYLAVDVTDAAAVRAALVDRGVNGIVHGAAVLADALLPDKGIEQIDRVFAPKLRGLAAVLDAVDTDRLRHLVVFTSIAGLLGNPGQADYAAANEALTRFVASWRHRHPDRHAIAIDWAAWDGGMVTPELRTLFASRGVPLLDPATGACAFANEFAASRRGDTRVLIGAATALGGSGPVPAPARIAHRELAALHHDPVIQDHRIGTQAVLPATFGLGWLINVAERAHPGLRVVRVRGFQVNKGIVFDDGPDIPRWVELSDARIEGDRVFVDASARGDSGRTLPMSHYAATLELAAAAGSTPMRPPRPSGIGAQDGASIYTSATQFHGPLLQGLREVLEFTDERLVVRCHLTDTRVANGAFTGILHSPVLADLLLQGPSALGSRLLGQACLPLAIGVAEYYAPLPGDADFVLVVDGVRRNANGITATATATDEAGRVLMRFDELAFVATPAMAAKFAESVAHRRDSVAHMPAAQSEMETAP